MRRMLCDVFFFAKYAGAMLFLLSLALWVRSYRSADAVHIQGTRQVDDVWDSNHIGVLGTRGRVVLYRQTSQAVRASDAPASRIGLRHLQAVPYDFVDALPRTATSSETFGLAVVRDFSSPGSAAVVVPFYVVALLMLPLAFLAGRDLRGRIVRRRWRRLGLCPDCGYDLRATPGTCPECGWRGDVNAGTHADETLAATMTPQGQEVS